MLPIPIGDVTRARRFPYVTIALLVLNVAVFVYQISLGAAGDQFVLAYGTIPYQIITGQDLQPLIPYPVWVTLFTSMFMHGGIMHLIGNMLYLWVFGDNVEDSMGHGKFIAFYLICGLLAGAAHIWSEPLSRVPAVGASGAISGIMGAYMVLHPLGQVRSLLIIFFFIRIIYLPAWLLLGAWFIFQLLPGLQALGGGAESGIAFWAHIGGFVAGVLLIFLFRDRRQAVWSRASWR